MSLPRISSSRSFSAISEQLDDLVTPASHFTEEFGKVQSVLEKNKVILEQAYNSKPSFNRLHFGEFCASNMSGLCPPDGGVMANEIFSCATSLYAPEGEVGCGADCDMSRNQFATAIVRLANLVAMMNDGIDGNSSKIAQQTHAFLQTL